MDKVAQTLQPRSLRWFATILAASKKPPSFSASQKEFMQFLHHFDENASLPDVPLSIQNLQDDHLAAFAELGGILLE